MNALNQGEKERERGSGVGGNSKSPHLPCRKTTTADIKTIVVS